MSANPESVSGDTRPRETAPRTDPEMEVANIECHIKTLLPADYLASIGANVQAPYHQRELHHRCMRIFADLAERLAALAASPAPSGDWPLFERAQSALDHCVAVLDADGCDCGQEEVCALCEARAALADLKGLPMPASPAPGTGTPTLALAELGGILDTAANRPAVTKIILWQAICDWKDRALAAPADTGTCGECQYWERSQMVRGADIDLPNPPTHPALHGRCGLANSYMGLLFTNGEDDVLTGERFGCVGFSPRREGPR